MLREEVEWMMNLICSAAVDAVNDYVEQSGESTDQMPEFVMSAGVAHRLGCCGIPVILEVDAKTLQTRLASITEIEAASVIERIKSNLRNGRIDLVVLSTSKDPQSRQPTGFVEFKKWKYHNGDVDRVARLLADIPGAKFGVCVVMRNTSKDDPWHCEMQKSLGPNGFVIASDTKGRNQTGQICCVACFGKLASRQDIQT